MIFGCRYLFTSPKPNNASTPPNNAGVVQIQHRRASYGNRTRPAWFVPGFLKSAAQLTIFEQKTRYTVGI